MTQYKPGQNKDTSPRKPSCKTPYQTGDQRQSQDKTSDPTKKHGQSQILGQSKEKNSEGVGRNPSNPIGGKRF